MAFEQMIAQLRAAGCRARMHRADPVGPTPIAPSSTSDGWQWASTRNACGSRSSSMILRRKRKIPRVSSSGWSYSALARWRRRSRRCRVAARPARAAAHRSPRWHVCPHDNATSICSGRSSDRSGARAQPRHSRPQRHHRQRPSRQIANHQIDQPETGLVVIESRKAHRLSLISSMTHEK